MKVDLTPQAGEKPKYPYLGIFPNGEVVLFTRKETGVSLVDWRVGHHSTGWDEQSTVPYTGTVTLKND